jgi:biotin-(acetyl-CoA carboxylase) ligase
LAEAAWEGGNLDSIILGVGVNVLRGSAPPDSEVDFPATSVEESLGRPVDRIPLLAQILHHLDRWYQEFGSPELLAAWEHFLCYRDEPVLVLGGGQPTRGILRGLGRTGSLLLEIPGRGVAEVRPDRAQLRPIDSLEESATLEGGEGPDVRQPA